jgi:signal transduction histidine kinase/CheY-like chemotaxis protein
MVPLRRISATRAACILSFVAAFATLPATTSAGAVPHPVDADRYAAFDGAIDECKATMLADPVKAERLARAAAAVATAWPAGAKREIALATTQWLEGEGAYRTNRVTLAEPLIVAALHTAERVAPGSKLNADLLLSRARIAVAQGRPQIGLGDLQKAYTLFARLGDRRSEAKALQSIGSIYQDAQDFNRVLYYYQLAREVYPSDPTLGLSASNNMANAYAQTGRLDAAMREYRRALEIARELKSPLLTARILDNIADLQIIDRQFDMARATVAEGLVLSREPQALAQRPTLLGTLARLDIAEGHFAAAVQAIEAAFASVDDASTNQAYRPVHLTAYQAYKASGDFAHALEHLEAFRALDDAGRTLATSTSSALMAARFDFANQKASIARLRTAQLQADVVLAQLEARQRTMLLAGLLVLVAGASLFLVVYLKSLRRSRNEIIAANLQLAQSNTELAEALLAKSQFLATTSHEIRTPLNGILGMTQVMLADRTVTGELRTRIGLVHSAGRSMRTLVDDILDFAKMDSGALAIESAPVDLATVLPDLVSLWRVEAVDKGISLELELDDTLVPVMTDIVRLRQVIFNLLSNAVKFTTEGSVQVSAARVVADGAEQLVFAFHDTGVGIPAAAFETIFEPFRQLDTSTTRRFGGTGLGLAISRHLARALGGDITVDSVLGASSTFSLRLPYVRAETAAASAAAPDTDRAGRTRARLLIVGSNPIGRSMLRTRLDPHFDRCTACDVDEAAERVREGAPDLLLIDADGLEDDHLIALLDQLARVDLAVAVLGPAAMTVPASVLRAHGAADVIVKPVSVDRLVEALGALSPLEAALLIDDDINN